MSENQPFCLNHLLFADFAVNVWLISHTDRYISILTLLNEKDKRTHEEKNVASPNTTITFKKITQVFTEKW